MGGQLSESATFLSQGLHFFVCFRPKLWPYHVYRLWSGPSALRRSRVCDLLKNLKSITDRCKLHRGLCLPADLAVVTASEGHHRGCFPKPLQPASLLGIIRGSGNTPCASRPRPPSGHGTDFTNLCILGSACLSAPRTGCSDGRAEPEASSWSPPRGQPGEGGSVTCLFHICVSRHRRAGGRVSGAIVLS